MQKVFVSTVPFGANGLEPHKKLLDIGCEVQFNSSGIKYKPSELIEKIADVTILIAGTEMIDKHVLDYAKNLQLICRVGIGLDSVDLIEAKNRNIKVSHTPDAPSPAVAELTIGLFFDLLRETTFATEKIRQGKWIRRFGKRIDKSKIGLIGFGRIGKLVAKKLRALGVHDILINDIRPETIKEIEAQGYTFADKEQIFRDSDLISFHLPLSSSTLNLCTKKQFDMMKTSASIVNTSRGGIVNEKDLLYALQIGQISSAALDVFEDEPYDGPLITCDNIVLTSHMGSMTHDCRARMEQEACEEAVRFISGITLKYPAWV